MRDIEDLTTLLLEAEEKLLEMKEKFSVIEEQHFNTVRALSNEIDIQQMELSAKREMGRFYNDISDVLVTNETIKSEWIRFCSFLRMAEPDITDYSNIFEKWKE